VTSGEFTDLLKAHDLTLVSWGQIQSVMGDR